MLFAANNNIDSVKNDKLNELKVKSKPSPIFLQKSKQTTHLLPLLVATASESRIPRIPWPLIHNPFYLTSSN